MMAATVASTTTNLDTNGAGNAFTLNRDITGTGTLNGIGRTAQVLAQKFPEFVVEVRGDGTGGVKITLDGVHRFREGGVGNGDKRIVAENPARGIEPAPARAATTPKLPPTRRSSPSIRPSLPSG